MPGELAVVNGDNTKAYMLKTPVLKANTVVIALHDAKSKIGIFAYVDKHTAIASVMPKIIEIFEKKFDSSIYPSMFTAKVFSPANDHSSTNLQAGIFKTLKMLGINFKTFALSNDHDSQPSQISFNARDGDVRLLKENLINDRLEYLQLREDADWNHSLETGLLKNQIPLFQMREANRSEHDIPYFEIDSIAKMQALEQQGLLKLPIQARRQPLSKEQLAILKLSDLIDSNYPDDITLQKSLAKNSFNLLLRQSATDPKYMKLLEFLLNNTTPLNIDVSSQGEKSGAALDIAKKCSNQKAVEILERAHGSTEDFPECKDSDRVFSGITGEYINDTKEIFNSLYGIQSGKGKNHRSTDELNNLMASTYPNELTLKQSIAKRDYNLLLRQSATDPKYLKLLEFLLDNKSSLKIDISARGKNSGTAQDIAEKCKNQQAVLLLTKSSFTSMFSSFSF